MYDLLLPKVVRTLDLGDWGERGGDGLALPAPPQRIEARCGTEHPPLLMQCARMPLFHRDIVLALQALGADALQTIPVTLRTPRHGHDAWLAVNVIGRVSLADIAGQLPDPGTLPDRRQPFVHEAMRRAAASLARIDAQRRPPLADPPPLARLAEGGHPLVIRSDIRAALDARFTVPRPGGDLHHIRFDDLRFSDLYTGTSFPQLAAEAAADDRRALPAHVAR